MSRSRCRLSVNHLERFAAYLEEKGWVRHQPHGHYEVLFMRHPDQRDPLIVHKRASTDMKGAGYHLTTWGISDRMASEYIRDKKVKP
jgi:hypothetical protein